MIDEKYKEKVAIQKYHAVRGTQSPVISLPIVKISSTPVVETIMIYGARGLRASGEREDLQNLNCLGLAGGFLKKW